MIICITITFLSPDKLKMGGNGNISIWSGNRKDLSFTLSRKSCILDYVEDECTKLTVESLKFLRSMGVVWQTNAVHNCGKVEKAVWLDIFLKQVQLIDLRNLMKQQGGDSQRDYIFLYLLQVQVGTLFFSLVLAFKLFLWNIEWICRGKSMDHKESAGERWIVQLVQWKYGHNLLTDWR